MPPCTQGPANVTMPFSVIEDTRPEPLADQADDARIADPMVQKTQQPFRDHVVEERSDIGIQDEAHLRAVDPDTERVQRVVLARPGRNPYENPRKSSL